MSTPERQVLLEHVGFLRAIALGVLRNEADADDAVQQTLATALQKPPADDTNVRGWLATVVKNFARMQLRSRSRRQAREEAVARPEGAGVSAAQIAQRMEMERHVVDAIATLEEPFQTTLVLRFYDDLAPREIATRMGVPAATVRTRLKRGLDKLRTRLEEKNDGNRKATYAGLLLLAQLPSRSAPPVNWMPFACAAALVTCLVSLAVLVARISEWPREAPPRTVVVDRGSGIDGEDAGNRGSPLAAAAYSISGRVFLGEVPISENAEVIAYPHAGTALLDTPETRWERWTEAPKAIARAGTDLAGRYTIWIDPPRPVWLVYRAPGCAAVLIPVPGTTESRTDVDVALRDEVVHGVLRDAQTSIGIADATIHAWGSGYSPFGTPALLSAKTDEDGQFTLPFAAEESVDGESRPVRISLIVDARTSGFAPRMFRSQEASTLDLVIQRSEPLSIRTEPGARVMAAASRAIDVAIADEKGIARFTEFPDTVGSLIVTHPQRVARHERTWLKGEEEIQIPLQPGELVKGRVELRESGQPLVGAVLGVTPGSRAQATRFDTLVATRTDAEGRYAIRLRPGQGREVAIAHEAVGVIRRTRRRNVIRLDVARAVTGTVMDLRWKPIPGCRVYLEPHDWLTSWAGDHRRLWTGITRGDGRYVILGAPRMDKVDVVAEHARFGSLRMRGDPAVVEYDFTLAGLDRSARPEVAQETESPSGAAVTLRGVVVDRSRKKLSGVEVRARTAVHGWETTGPDGDFSLRVRGPFPHIVILRHGNVIREVEYRSANHSPEWTMPSGPAFTGRVVHAGQPIPGASVRLVLGSKARERARTDADGRFSLFRRLLTAPDEIVIEAVGYETIRLTPPLPADIELSPAAAIVIRVIDDSGAAVPQVELQFGERRVVSDRDGVIRLYKTQQERPVFTVVPGGPGWIAVDKPQWSKDERIVKLVVRRGERIEGRVVDSENRGVPHILVLAHPTVEGRAPRRAFTNSKGYFVLRGLHPERYQLRVGEAADGVEIEAGTKELVLRKESR